MREKRKIEGVKQRGRSQYGFTGLFFQYSAFPLHCCCKHSVEYFIGIFSKGNRLCCRSVGCCQAD